jgi:hypothetical protein
MFSFDFMYKFNVLLNILFFLYVLDKQAGQIPGISPDFFKVPQADGAHGDNGLAWFGKLLCPKIHDLAGQLG